MHLSSNINKNQSKWALNPLIPNFSLQCQYNIKQTSDENKVKYQLEDHKLIQYQILQTNITKTVCQTVGRITNEILALKGLIQPNIYIAPVDL